jgi:hypothetical protein
MPARSGTTASRGQDVEPGRATVVSLNLFASAYCVITVDGSKNAVRGSLYPWDTIGGTRPTAHAE